MSDRERPKIPPDVEGYLDEKLTNLEKYVLRIRKALTDKDAKNFIDQMGAIQWTERSLVAGCKQLMEIEHFTEDDLCMRPLETYVNTETQVKRICETCKLWTRDKKKQQGTCASEHFVYEPEEGTPTIGLSYWDQECYSAGIYTGPEFGCIHWASSLASEEA